MEIINDLRADIVKLQAEIQSLKVQVAKPPVVNIDTAKLATVITDKLSGYTDAGDKVAGRIEAAAASIPRSVATRWGIYADTKWFLLILLVLTTAAVYTGYVLSPTIAEQYIKYQQRNIEAQGDELNFLRRKNPRDAAQYAREH